MVFRDFLQNFLFGNGLNLMSLVIFFYRLYIQFEDVVAVFQNPKFPGSHCVQVIFVCLLFISFSQIKEMYFFLSLSICFLFVYYWFWPHSLREMFLLFCIFSSIGIAFFFFFLEWNQNWQFFDGYLSFYIQNSTIKKKFTIFYFSHKMSRFEHWDTLIWFLIILILI